MVVQEPVRRLPWRRHQRPAGSVALGGCHRLLPGWSGSPGEGVANLLGRAEGRPARALPPLPREGPQPRGRHLPAPAPGRQSARDARPATRAAARQGVDAQAQAPARHRPPGARDARDAPASQRRLGDQLHSAAVAKAASRAAPERGGRGRPRARAPGDALDRRGRRELPATADRAGTAAAAAAAARPSAPRKQSQQLRPGRTHQVRPKDMGEVAPHAAH